MQKNKKIYIGCILFTIIIVILVLKIDTNQNSVRGDKKIMVTLPLWFEKKIIKKKEDVVKIKDDIINLYNKLKNTLLSYQDTPLTENNIDDIFTKTYYFQDCISNQISKKLAYLHYYELLGYGDQEVMDEIQKAQQEINSFAIKNIQYNKDIYILLKKVGTCFLDREVITCCYPVEKKLIEDTMKAYKKIGIDLDEETKNKVQHLLIDLDELSLQFSINIQNTDNHIMVNEESLDGLNTEQKKRLEKVLDNKYKLGVDYPTYELIMKYCNVRETREALYKQFITRAFPKNQEIFNTFRNKKHELATLLGYNNFAEYDLDNAMAKKVGIVSSFLDDIAQATEEKARDEKKELEKFARELFSDNNFIIQAWDIAYINEQYKQKYYHLNSEEISKYFPTMETIDKLLQVYCIFFDINMKIVQYDAQITDWAYNENVYVVRCTHKDNTIIGDIILDLFPRQKKYSHACQFGIVSAVLNDTETNLQEHPIVAIIANFNKPTEDTPSFLYMNQVETFFHEFGHALHSLFGQSKWSCFAGTAVYSDFVETPSQLFEFWLLDKKVLKIVSHHYKTGQSLPDDIIDQLINEHYFSIALQYQSHLFNMNLCLNLFVDNNQNIQTLIEKYNKSCIRLSNTPIQESFVASFGHLTSSLYGPKYYAYLWSFMYSIAIFDYIKKYDGLLDKTYGKKLREKILSKGGAIEPDILISNFLDGQSFDRVRLFKKYINRKL